MKAFYQLFIISFHCLHLCMYACNILRDVWTKSTPNSLAESFVKNLSEIHSQGCNIIVVLSNDVNFLHKIGNNTDVNIPVNKYIAFPNSFFLYVIHGHRNSSTFTNIESSDMQIACREIFCKLFVLEMCSVLNKTNVIMENTKLCFVDDMHYMEKNHGFALLFHRKQFVLLNDPKTLILKRDIIESMPEKYFREINSLMLIDATYDCMKQIYASIFDILETCFRRLNSKYYNLPIITNKSTIYLCIIKQLCISHRSLSLWELFNFNRVILGVKAKGELNLEVLPNINPIWLPLKLLDISKSRRKYINILIFLKSCRLMLLNKQGTEKILEWLSNINTTYFMDDKSIIHSRKPFLLLVYSGIHHITQLPPSPNDMDYSRQTSIEFIRNSWKQLTLTGNCPRVCQCFVLLNEHLTTVVNCKGRSLELAPSVVPFGTEVIDLENNNIDSLSNINFHWWQEVTRLILRNNIFNWLNYEDIPPHVTILDLHGNRLKELSFDLMEKVHFTEGYKIYLANNHWSCTCDTLKFFEWFKNNSEKIQDSNETFCIRYNNSERHISLMINITSQLFCRYIVPDYRSILIGSIAALVFFISMSFLYVEREFLLAMLYYYNFYPSFAFSEKSTDEKLYDLFVSYHIKDSETASIIISILEANYKICIQEHYWLPKLRADKDMIFRFKASRMMILFLSVRFVRSAWFQVEFPKIYDKEIKGNMFKLIPIVIKEMGDDPEYLRILSELFPSVHFLIWGERFFWQKLHYALRHIPKRERNDYLYN